MKHKLKIYAHESAIWCECGSVYTSMKSFNDHIRYHKNKTGNKSIKPEENKMNKVWIVMETQSDGPYDQPTILGAYSSDARAEAEVAALKKLYDHEYSVDLIIIDEDSWLEDNNLNGGENENNEKIILSFDVIGAW